MAGELLEIDLGERGGVLRFRSYEKIREWIARERARWAWAQTPGLADPGGLAGYIPDRLNWLASRVGQLEAAPEPITACAQPFTEVYLQPTSILNSQGELGRRVLDIQKAAGDAAATMAYAFAVNRASIGSVGSPDMMRGLLMVSAPSMIEPDAIAAELGRERRNLRQRADTLIDALEAAETERQVSFDKALSSSHRFARRRLLRWARQWNDRFTTSVEAGNRAQVSYEDLSQKTQAEFEQTRATYKEAMRLQAPVEYWQAKATTHGKAEGEAIVRLLWYFPIALLILAGSFGETAYYLLNHPVKDPPTALFLIISGGLAALAGLLFWVGRLLTRLYLSEHHLRHDAEERAVMTTTYLALTHEKAAEEADRQIILGALFRATTDGIVKDDGPGDFTLPALLARALTPGKG